MKKTNKTKVEEFIRVDHAGERGAIKIYEGQLLALNTLVNDENLKKTIEEMKIHEKEHCDFFENEIKKRNIKTTKFLPIWDLLGVTLGFGSALLGKKAAMLCTASVEEVIDEHYQNQINQLMPDENILKEKIKKFREDELHHKDIAYKNGATKKVNNTTYKSRLKNISDCICIEHEEVSSEEDGLITQYFYSCKQEIKQCMNIKSFTFFAMNSGYIVLQILDK